MEKFSETKGRGGRPRLIRAELRRTVDFAVGNPNATERTKQNKLYQMRAMRALGLTLEGDTPTAYLWVWGKPNDPRPGDHRVKWTVLAELGRIDDDETMRAVAARVCELKPMTRAAVRMIRQFRTGKTRPASTSQLADEIAAVVNDYGARHEALTPEMIREALGAVARRIVDE